MAGFALTFVIVGCTSDGDGSPGASDGGGGSYTIGVSNTLTNNGWREEMICSIQAQSAVSGEVASISESHRDTDAAGQLEDIRNLIAEEVDAIIVNPADRSAIDEALAEATEAGITVVTVDQAVTEESAFVLSNDQEQYAYLGATWLFEQLGGEGDVVYMRGIAGAAADDDRDTGFQRALEENPGITVVFESHTDWDQATGVQQFTDFLATGDNFDGIWTSGIDNVIVEAMIDADVELVPIVGADNCRLRPAAARGRGPGRCRGHQLRRGRRRRRHAGAADPQRRGAGRADHAHGAPDLVERHRGGHRRASRRPTTPTSIRPGRCSTPSRAGPTTRRKTSSPARGRNLRLIG